MWDRRFHPIIEAPKAALLSLNSSTASLSLNWQRGNKKSLPNSLIIIYERQTVPPWRKISKSFENQNVLMEKIKRSVLVSNILSLQTFWPHVKHLPGVVACRLDAMCAELKHKSPNSTTHHQARLISLLCLMAAPTDWLAWSGWTRLNTEVFRVHAVDSEPGLMVYAPPRFAWFVLLSPRCHFTLYMGRVLNIFLCTCTLLYHIMETASGKHDMSQWQPSGQRSGHSRRHSSSAWCFFII